MMMKWGTTFSVKYSRELGLDWKMTLTKILELDFQSIRICAYWDLLEPSRGTFDFDDLDTQIEMASAKNLEITLALGRKVPRWPEFHEPDWAVWSGKKELFESTNKYISAVVNRYKKQNHIVRWQVENEPFYSFGESKYPIDKKQVTHEIELVRSIDSRPILITDSGEWGDWKKAAKYGNEVGINMYKIVLTKRGYKEYSFSPEHYVRKARRIDKPVMIAELQAEPWGPGIPSSLPESEWQESINPTQLRKNVELALATGFQEIWFWGAEWWVYLDINGDDSMILTVKEIMNS